MLPECTCQHTFPCIVETQRGSKTGQTMALRLLSKTVVRMFTLNLIWFMLATKLQLEFKSPSVLQRTTSVWQALDSSGSRAAQRRPWHGP